MNVLAVVAGVPFVVVGLGAAAYGQPLAAWNQKKAAEWNQKKAGVALDDADPVKQALNGPLGVYVFAVGCVVGGIAFIGAGLTNQFSRHHSDRGAGHGPGWGVLVGLLLVVGLVAALAFVKRTKARGRDRHGS